MKASHGLDSHPIFRETVDELAPTLAEALEHSLTEVDSFAELFRDLTVEWPQHLAYPLEVFGRAITLTNALERLEQAERLLDEFPDETVLDNLGLSKGGWMEYHLTIYRITLSSILDIALQLVNVVFRLGIRPRDVNSMSIMKNGWVLLSPVKNALGELEEMCKPHREAKNLFVHHGRAPEVAKLSGSDLYQGLEIIASVNAKAEKRFADPAFLEKAYRLEATRLTRALRLERAKACVSCKILLDDLLPVFRKRGLVLREDVPKADA